EMKAAEEQADLFRRMVDRAAEIILLVDPQSGRVLYGNEGAARALGYPAEALTSLTVADIVVMPGVAEWWREMQQARRGERKGEEGVLRRKAGSLFPVEMTAQVSQSGGEEYALLMAHDIADRLRHTRLQEVARSLEEANRELKDFNAVVSHDLQSPLTTISGFSKRLIERLEGKLDEREADYLKRIDGAARRMSQLISDLLEYSWAGGVSTKAEKIDLTPLVKGLVADMAGSVEACGGTVEIGELPSVYGDQTLLRQAFQNLVGNALKYRKEGVAPLVKVFHDPSCDEPDRVTIVVQDNGIGFEPEQADRIFRVFERLHGNERYQGTGIGLATTRKIVERHGGTISATAAPGEGATFFVTLTSAQG
ncbi:MAG: PAS domain S-box protein, partial [Nitrospinae bacterium]|nr:PAS domain S-box protein [Nitrospinota bacterium]